MKHKISIPLLLLKFSLVALFMCLMCPLVMPPSKLHANNRSLHEWVCIHRNMVIAYIAFPCGKMSLKKVQSLIEESPEYLRVEFRTLLFTDDGEFFLDGKQSLIQVRSASRLGYSDLGKNRGWLEEIRRQFADTEKKQE